MRLLCCGLYFPFLCLVALRRVFLLRIARRPPQARGGCEEGRSQATCGAGGGGDGLGERPFSAGLHSSQHGVAVNLHALFCHSEAGWERASHDRANAAAQKRYILPDQRLCLLAAPLARPAPALSERGPSRRSAKQARLHAARNCSNASILFFALAAAVSPPRARRLRRPPPRR